VVARGYRPQDSSRASARSVPSPRVAAVRDCPRAEKFNPPPPRGLLGGRSLLILIDQAQVSNTLRELVILRPKQVTASGFGRLRRDKPILVKLLQALLDREV